MDNAVRQAYAAKVGFVADLAYKTRRLIEGSAIQEGLGRLSKSVTFDVKTLDSIRDEPGSDEGKVFNLYPTGARWRGPGNDLGVVRGALRAPFSARPNAGETRVHEKTRADEVFKRFSAYENDRRVTAEKGLLPGTYATTEKDARNVKTGKEAVARYALPNPEPTSYVFTVKPEEDTDIQRGTVEPANGQPGGGVEVIFTNGTVPNTVTLPPAKIPD